MYLRLREEVSVEEVSVEEVSVEEVSVEVMFVFPSAWRVCWSTR